LLNPAPYYWVIPKLLGSDVQTDSLHMGKCGLKESFCHADDHKDPEDISPFSCDFEKLLVQRHLKIKSLSG
jgi:hypothetical protein